MKDKISTNKPKLKKGRIKSCLKKKSKTQQLLEIINGPYYTFRYSTRALHISTDTLNELIESGKISTVDNGKRISKAEIKKYLTQAENEKCTL